MMRGSSGRGSVAGAAFIAALVGMGGLPNGMKNASPCLQHSVREECRPIASSELRG